MKKTFEVTATIKAKLSIEDLDDIMCSALEGGITYWCCQAEVVGDYLAEYAHEQVARGGSLILHDAESNAKWALTREKFLDGVALWLADVGNMVLENGNLDPGQVDSEDADRIVQYALFGEVVFA